MFAPSQDSVDAVRAWLVDSGIEPTRISISKGLNWLKFDATVEEAESLFHTEYKVFGHDSGKEHIACDEYSIPADLSQHVDFITPTVQFDVKVPNKPKMKKRDAIQKRRVLPIADHEAIVPMPDVGGSTDVTFSLANCYEYVFACYFGKLNHADYLPGI